MKTTELLNLKGKTALVTGGSQGIGRAIALILAEQGADVVINYHADRSSALQTHHEITQMGVRCWILEADLVSSGSPEEISGFLTMHHIAIDILVLNASVQYRKPWDQVTLDEFEKQINLNLRASLFLIQRLYTGMQKRKWGRILTIGSVQQIQPHPEMIVYAASKEAQYSMVKTLAKQFGPHGVTINNLAPGAILTKRNEEALKDADYTVRVEAKIPLGFIGDPTDCAMTALLLCSDAGRYITGQSFAVDGGMSLHV